MRVSRTVLREAEGVTPSAYSPSHFVARPRGQRVDAVLPFAQAILKSLQKATESSDRPGFLSRARQHRVYPLAPYVNSDFSDS